MALRRKMHERVYVVFNQQLFNQRLIVNRTLHEGKPRLAQCRGKIVLVAGIAKAVERDDRVVGISPVPVVHKIGTDESCCAGDE